MATELDTPLKQACGERGLDATDARLIHHYSNAIYLLPSERAVARVTVGTGSSERAKRTVAVTDWLVTTFDYGATAPLADAGVVAIEETTAVSFWQYYSQNGATVPLTSSALGALLRELHTVGSPPLELPNWVPLESLEATVCDDRLAAALSDDKREWLITQIHKIRGGLDELDWPLGRGLIHGDAWAGNLLADPSRQRAILGDWDWVSIGPREVDLIPTWHATVRYGRDESWVNGFVEQYGYDLRSWGDYDMLLAMRDLVQLTGPLRRASGGDPQHAARLRQRFDAIRSGDRSSRWASR